MYIYISFFHLHFNRRSQSDTLDDASRAEMCIEIAELISPEIFSHIEITNINCMYGNAPRTINQDDRKATSLREYCYHLFFIYCGNFENETSKISPSLHIAIQMLIVFKGINYNASYNT